GDRWRLKRAHRVVNPLVVPSARRRTEWRGKPFRGELIREGLHDGGGFEHHEIAVNESGNSAVWIQRELLRLLLVARPEVNADQFVRFTDLLEHPAGTACASLRRVIEFQVRYAHGVTLLELRRLWLRSRSLTLPFSRAGHHVQPPVFRTAAWPASAATAC